MSLRKFARGLSDRESVELSASIQPSRNSFDEIDRARPERNAGYSTGSERMALDGDAEGLLREPDAFVSDRYRRSKTSKCIDAGPVQGHHILNLIRAVEVCHYFAGLLEIPVRFLIVTSSMSGKVSDHSMPRHISEISEVSEILAECDSTHPCC